MCVWGGGRGGGAHQRTGLGLVSTYSPPSDGGIIQSGGRRADSFNSLKGAQIRSRERQGTEGTKMGGRS